MMKDTSPPKEIINHFHYDCETGVFIRLRTNKRADIMNGKGYRRVQYKSRYYQAHRLAWYFQFGEWPKLLIDHINLDKQDNRIANLRLANHSQNTIHRKTNGKYPRGVVYHKSTKKYMSQIKCNRKTIYLGIYRTPEEAHEAYRKASLKHHGNFASFE